MSILAFDTSNYTTSACLFDETRGILWQNRMIIHPPLEQKGLRQSEVVFQHIKNFETLLDGMPDEKITCVAASDRPRPVDGSYMPCFLVGKNFALCMADVLHCPVRFYSHQQNHIMAGLYTADALRILSNDFVVFHVSGGTTDILYVQNTASGLSIERIGGSDDLHAGQLVDRVGVMMGMRFPCGREVEKTAEGCDTFHKNKIKLRDLSFSLSGFENKARELLESGTRADAAKYTLDMIAQSLDAAIFAVRERYAGIPILMVGGVMANRIISAHLTAGKSRIFFGDPFYSSDHALGNAVSCIYF